jgi:predicted aldo/keto reductase-like oxidoreductase
MVSGVVFGGNLLGATSQGQLEVAIEMGLNCIDTAPQYGRGTSERAVAKVIAGSKRERVFVATKISSWENTRNAWFRNRFEGLPEGEKNSALEAARADIGKRRAADEDYFGDYFPNQDKQLEASALSNVLEERSGDNGWRKNSAAEIVRSVEESLERLGTDYIDILICPHAASGAYEVTRFPETFEAFERLKKAGKARHLGVSAHTDPAGVIRGAIEAKVYSMAMVAYNIVNHAYVDEALAEAARADLGIVAMKVARPVHPGRAYGTPVKPHRLERLHRAVPGEMKIPLKAYTFALRNPHVTAVNSEMAGPTMVRENLGLVTGTPPPA